MSDKSSSMELTSCPLCGSEASEVRYQVRNRHAESPRRFTFVECGECGLVYLNPRPGGDAMADYYPPTYDLYASSSSELSVPERWIVRYGLWKRCRPLVRHRSPGRILDIGCGKGHFLAAIRDMRWEPVGIDSNPDAVESARDDLQIEAYCRRFRDNEFAAAAFDAVTMWDSLEHLHEPREALLEVKRILKPGGLLLLRVPSLDSLDARLFGAFWAGLDPPRHLTVFSRETLVRLLTETGFTVERSWCMSGSHASFVLSLRSYLEQRGSNGVAGAVLKAFLRALSNPVGQVLSSPYFYFVDKLALGPEITTLCRKRERTNRQ